MPSQTFACGRRPPVNKRCLSFTNYLRAVPTVPPVNYLPKVNWSPTMNGNDLAGDCVACEILNSALLTSTVLADKPVAGTKADAYAFYRTQNPGFDPNSRLHGPGSADDRGMVIQTALETLVKTGISIGGVVYKALGFARVDTSNLAVLRAAISVFGTVSLGVNLAAAQQSGFPNKVWDYVRTSPIVGGHAIMAGGHLDLPTNDVQAACWAAAFSTTDAFIQHQAEEGWVIIWPWHLKSKQFMDSMDLAALAEDYWQLTGQLFPVDLPPPVVVVPPPTPTPVPPVPVPPTPVVDPVDATFAAAAKTWLAAKKLA